MRKLMMAAAIAALLAGCSATQQAQTTQAIQEAQQACVSISPALNAAAGSTNATVQSVAGFANSVCGPLAAGSVPATVNSTTPTWLGSLGGMISALLPVAISLL